MVAAEGMDLVVGADLRYLRRMNVLAQLSHARPELHVHSTLADTIEACRTAYGRHDEHWVDGARCPRPRVAVGALPQAVVEVDS